jgi:hypothetical protein
MTKLSRMIKGDKGDGVNRDEPNILRSTEKQVTKTGDRQDDYLHIHGSKVIVLSATCFPQSVFSRDS